MTGPYSNSLGRDTAMEVSVVIPALDAAAHLPRLLAAIEEQALLPVEVIIVDSSGDDATELLVSRWRGRVPVRCHRLAFAYPGHARNAGAALAVGRWIAFLDCRTVPDVDWLKISCRVAAEEGADYVPGLFTTRASTHFQQVLLAATYGNLPVTSLPGTLLLKKVFEQSGGFVPGARAGEDVEWMARLAPLGVRKAEVDRPLLRYEGLPETFGAALRKWYVYAMANSRVNIRIYQKFFYVLLLFGASLLFVYNWNNLFAHWKETSIYYIPNITKLFLAAVLFFYAVSQGIVNPVRKNFRPGFLLPFTWVEIVALRACLDIVKAPGMIMGALVHLLGQTDSPGKVSDPYRS